MKTVGYLAIVAIVVCAGYLGANKGTPEFAMAAQAMQQGR